MKCIPIVCTYICMYMQCTYIHTYNTINRPERAPALTMYGRHMKVGAAHKSHSLVTNNSHLIKNEVTVSVFFFSLFRCVVTLFTDEWRIGDWGCWFSVVVLLLCLWFLYRVQYVELQPQVGRERAGAQRTNKTRSSTTCQMLTKKYGDNES